MCVKRRWLITFLLMLRGFYAWELVSLASSRVAGYIDANPGKSIYSRPDRFQESRIFVMVLRKRRERREEDFGEIYNSMLR